MNCKPKRLYSCGFLIVILFEVTRVINNQFHNTMILPALFVLDKERISLQDVCEMTEKTKQSTPMRRTVGFTMERMDLCPVSNGPLGKGRACSRVKAGFSYPYAVWEKRAHMMSSNFLFYPLQPHTSTRDGQSIFCVQPLD